MKKNEHDILLLDMDMPHITGLDILEFIKENHLPVITIVLTGVEDIDLAISAMKLDTFDYMLKPIEEEKILDAIETAVSKINGKEPGDKASSIDYREGLKHKEAFQDIITQDNEMLRIFKVVEKYAITDNSVLIWGESGTGKELVAKAIHQISPRGNKKFVAVNAGSFANELFESEFFGYKKGAFTGAVSDKKGFIEEADGGTLFLNEIGELSLPIQVKLLRFLQEEEFYRIGSTQNMRANVRIIAATNKNLFDEIKQGNFRKDLFFRLNINSISIPPLRERKGDIPLLTNFFLKDFNEKYGKNVQKPAPGVINFLNTYPFPGNVRELMNIINSAIIIESSGELKRKSLPNYLMEQNNVHPDIQSSIIPKSLQEMEKEHIQKVLEYTGMNRSKAAEILGISRVNLISKIKKYRIN